MSISLFDSAVEMDLLSGSLGDIVQDPMTAALETVSRSLTPYVNIDFNGSRVYLFIIFLLKINRFVSEFFRLINARSTSGFTN